MSKTKRSASGVGALEGVKMKRKKLTTVQDFLAGSYSGVIATLVGHPFDTVKVRMQQKSSLPSVIQQLRSGSGFVRSVYKGLYAPLLSVPLANAFVFSGYGMAKSVLVPDAGENGNERLPPLTTLCLCGGWAGFMQSFVMSPVELVRCRLQADTSKQKTGAHMREIRSIYLNEGGLRGFTRGFFATCLRDVPGFMVQFYVYEGLKRVLGTTSQTVNSTEHGLKLVVAGGTAGMVGWFATYPQDIIKTNLQLARTPRTLFNREYVRCGAEIWKDAGIQGFFRGVSPCLLRAIPVNGFGFLAYEQAAAWFRG